MAEHTKEISKANEALRLNKLQYKETKYKPLYHFSAPSGWINDPNGFIQYKDQYHLFYQHHPYSSDWGPMHWGHATSDDLINWNHESVALAPTEDYDRDGCFSGSAIEKDGTLYLMYTGHTWTGENHDEDLKQVQCLAKSEDGINFNKIKGNPVIDQPNFESVHPNHVRDPKIWMKNNTYYCVIGSKNRDNVGQVIMYESKDLKEWEFVNVITKGEGNAGFMWECPDLFHSNGKDVLIYSPQGVKPEGCLYHNLHQSGYVVGDLDYQTGEFEHDAFQLLDYGFDFYAPQTLIDGSGRRILIAWMNMWESEMPEKEEGWAGAFTLPRELKIENQRLIIQPIVEVKELRTDRVNYNNLLINELKEIKGVNGQTIEIDLIVDMKNADLFGMKLCTNSEMTEKTMIQYRKSKEKLMLNRDKSGKGPIGERAAFVKLKDNRLHLNIFLDYSSLEVFINHGEKVMSARIYPDKLSDRILFFSDNDTELVKLEKWKMGQKI
ncbi:glycoside hydrolase family 32 protein [Salipaludibacillus sp. HK11]|uniref:glycoside hydrolase family 32 protein n=1 Tax=Salipaludibacillus sp. HK11 TaxID=3394320 RepID=UPI0039FDDDA4